jgi:cholesterol transport system auxiliary component
MKKQSTLFLYSSWLLIFFILMGCTTLRKNYPERNYYILNVSNQERNLSPVSGIVLEVPRFKISPSFASSEFVYRKGDMNYESDFYNQFFSPPSLLITEEARKWLSESGLFKYVVDPANSMGSDYILAGNINELYGDYRISTPKAVLGIQFFLIDEMSPNSQIIFMSNYRREATLSDSSPKALVKGWSDALEQILGGLEGDLKKLNLTKSHR